jgi:peptide/nickel transport system permease protein
MSLFSFIKNPFKKRDTAIEIAHAHYDQSFWANVKKEFRKNKLAVFSLRFILFLTFIAITADFIANEKPFACGYKGNTYFPILKSYAVDIGIAKWPEDLKNAEWKDLQYDWSLFPLIPYLPKNIDGNNSQSVSPFETQNVKSTRWRHWLGTDELGHDVLAAMIHGTRIALLVGVISMFIASFIGIILGSLAGYFGDTRLKVSRASIISFSLFGVLGMFWAYGSRTYILRDALAQSFPSFIFQFLVSTCIFLAILMFARLLAYPFKSINYLRQKISIPLDIIISRLFEVMLSIPTLILIISVSAIVQEPNIFIVMVVIGLTSWTGIARFIRAELLRVRSLEYIESANALGFSEFRIIFRHAIPNALSPVLIAIAFGIASAILIESTLSFLGIGVPAETLTWGSLLSLARQTPTAWWLAIFPGFAIFITVTIFNLAGEGLTDALDPRNRK